jgi:hypothetical protein
MTDLRDQLGAFEDAAPASLRPCITCASRTQRGWWSVGVRHGCAGVNVSGGVP